MAKRIFPFLLLALLSAGCAAHFNNLTPQQVHRNNDNLYPVEVAFASRQQSLRWDSIHPYVLIGTESYPMRPVPLMKDRWETLVPAPRGTNVLHYRFKFDYLYNAVSQPKPDSATSQNFTLKIRE